MERGGAFYEGAPLIDELAHVIGPLAGEVHLLAGTWVHESECLGMESLTGTYLEAILYECLVGTAALASENFRSTIAFVAEKRMPDVFHVSPNLMCPPRFEYALDQRYVAEAFQHSVMGYRTLANAGVRSEHLHAKTVARVTCNVAFDAPFVLYEVAPD